MTPSELKANIWAAGHEPYFFDSKTMRFFGDTMANFGCRSVVITTNWDQHGNYKEGAGVEVECWELWRKRPVKGGNQGSSFFRKDNFRRVIVVDEEE